MHPGNKDALIPNFVGLSASFPTEYVCEIQKLTSIFFSDASIMWGTVDEFYNSDIDMQQFVVNRREYAKVRLSGAVDNLSHDSDNKSIVFCNSRNKAGHFGTELERKLN